MNLSVRSAAVLCGALSVFCLFDRAFAYDDPPGRVARLSNMYGSVSYSPGGEDAWSGALRNRPVIRGDRLWTDRDGRAELQFGGGTMRMSHDTSFEILELDDRTMQMQVSQGTVDLRLRRVSTGHAYEIDTPTLAFVATRRGRYRVEVDPDGQSTTVVVFEGEGTAFGDDAHFPLHGGDAVVFYDADLRDYEQIDVPRLDAFDRYVNDRDRRWERSVSARYVGADVIGYADLDDYGDWGTHDDYGAVWYPRRVGAGWAPYREGHWAWQEPWGWTWVDDQPWGFAPSHYGRWAFISSRWGWIPGPRNQRAVYAPALVAFIGGRNFSIGVGGGSPIGWFPLGPREVYVPPYRASEAYFTRVNVTNTVVNVTTITNVYNNYASGATSLAPIVYANRSIPGALTAVPVDAFVNARSVQQAAIRIDGATSARGELLRRAAFAPSARSVTGAAPAATGRPAQQVSERRVVARLAPPPELAPFAERQRDLRRNPGQAAQRALTRGRDAVHVVGAQTGAVNVRETVTERSARGERGVPQGRALEREPDASGAQRQADADAQRQADAQQRTERVRQAERERSRDAEAARAQQRQADAQQQAERSRRVEREPHADRERQEQAERQREAVAAEQAQQRAAAASEQREAAAAERAAAGQREAVAAERREAQAREATQQAEQAVREERAEQARQQELARQARARVADESAGRPEDDEDADGKPRKNPRGRDRDKDESGDPDHGKRE
jgi:hypothetical protein